MYGWWGTSTLRVEACVLECHHRSETAAAAGAFSGILTLWLNQYYTTHTSFYLNAAEQSDEMRT
jgi:hypothetical protein